MTWTTGLAIYFLIWWVVLFAVLPFGIKSQHEGETTPGTDPGARILPRFLSKVFWTTIGLCDSLRAALCGLRVPAYRARRHPGSCRGRFPDRCVVPAGTSGPAGRCLRHWKWSVAMPNSRYFILQQDENWLIRFRDGDFGPCRTRQEAMMFAVDAAQQLARRARTPSMPDGRKWAFPPGMDLRAGRLSAAAVAQKLQLAPLGKEKEQGNGPAQ